MNYSIQKIFGSYSISIMNDNTAKTYYDVQEDIIKIINELKQENNQLKEQYCERTDCGGRLGNSKKVERLENTIKELRSWLEERAFYLNSIFDRDIYEEQMMLDFSNI